MHSTGNKKLVLEHGLLKRHRAAAIFVAAGVSLLAGCRQDMHNQPKFVPQRGTSFFADGRSARPQVQNTVSRGQLHENGYFYTGMVGDKEGDGLPFPATLAVMQRGQERYNIYCTPCHSRVGNGVGMIVQRGYAQAGNFHTARLQAAPLGHFFNVISNGYGAMPDYSSQVGPEDRWAIAAYIRALQLSQNATAVDVSPGARVEPMAVVEEREGLPAHFADKWTLPPTSVTGTPNGQPFVLPGAGSAIPSAGPIAKSPTQPAAIKSSTQPVTPEAGPSKQQ